MSKKDWKITLDLSFLHKNTNSESLELRLLEKMLDSKVTSLKAELIDIAKREQSRWRKDPKRSEIIGVRNHQLQIDFYDTLSKVIRRKRHEISDQEKEIANIADRAIPIEIELASAGMSNEGTPICPEPVISKFLHPPEAYEEDKADLEEVKWLG